MAPLPQAPALHPDQSCFRIADLAGPNARPSTFRFANPKTVATTDHQYPALVEASTEFLRGDKDAFGAAGVAFRGESLSADEQETFALAVTAGCKTLHPRPIMGRFWKRIQIPNVGIFDGISFWITYPDLLRAPWAPEAAIKLLELRDPTYLETIDLCAPGIYRGNGSAMPLRSVIDPAMKDVEILGLLARAIARDSRITRKEWEIVSEFRNRAHDVAAAAATTLGQTIESRWRWQPDFNRMLIRRRAARARYPHSFA